jgi:hypothetical protein
MGYQITVKSNAGTHVVSLTGDVPDGEHVITGHDDVDLTSIQVERRSELGHTVITAENVTGPP